MKFNNPVFRLSLTLALVLASLLLVANQIGLIPDSSKSVLALRKGLSEALALQFSAASHKGDLSTIRNTIRMVVERTDDIRSAAIRTTNGDLIAVAGEHLANWHPSSDGRSTPTHIQVPVYRGDDLWATVELRFAPLFADRVLMGQKITFLNLLLFISVTSLILYFLLLKRSLRELDPATVIPGRVQNAFDVLQEGVLVLDNKEQIVMANHSFASFFNKTPQEMIGVKGSELGWKNITTNDQFKQLPWIKILREGREYESASLRLIDYQENEVKFSVNATPLMDNGSTIRGCLLTFDDITQLEEKNFELTHVIHKLKLANEVIKRKSKALEDLATRDPLTRCLNRRSFGEKIERLFAAAKQKKAELSCIMTDIDFFKSVNDNYGHAAGDEVLKDVSSILRDCCRKVGHVGRYGGEEFCIVLPLCSLEKAAGLAEKMRKTVAEKDCSGVKTSISLGVASLVSNANTFEALIDQADKALYTAKKSGRNRVIAWGKDSLEDQKITENAMPSQNPHSHEPAAEDSPKLRKRIKELEGLLKKRDLEIEHYKSYDYKTGMPNRGVFEERIDNEIIRAERQDQLFSVLLVSIGTIERVYETWGNATALQLIKACSDRLNDTIRRDVDTVAVFGKKAARPTVSMLTETDFGVLLSDIQQVDNVTWVMKRILDAFEKPFTIRGQEVFVSTYFGVSVFPHDGKTVESLTNSAINACHYARGRNGEGKSRYAFACPDFNKNAERAMEIENALHQAIDNNELELYYQPKVDPLTGMIRGFEALLRWQSKKLGNVSPGIFIPIAERSGLINQIGDWVIESACSQLGAWLRGRVQVQPVAINVSGIQLRRPSLINKIVKTLKKNEVDHRLLELELTESSLITTGDEAFVALERIKKLGIRITMDDFGTGYSSFSYLRKIPLSCLKVDRSFVMDINKDKRANNIVASIISMAHELGLDVVAEGVEEQHQVQLLKKLGCEYLQGYFYSRPIPAHEAGLLLEKQTIAKAS